MGRVADIPSEINIFIIIVILTYIIINVKFHDFLYFKKLCYLKLTVTSTS